VITITEDIVVTCSKCGVILTASSKEHVGYWTIEVIPCEECLL
jgi:hypothetical protein